MTAESTRVEPPLAESLVGSTLRGTYAIERVLDEGGMGMVFIAEHQRLRRKFAVKVLAKHLTEDVHALARFHREAEIISQLSHPCIVQVVDFDTTDSGEPYLVMELLQGESLDARLEREGRVSPAETVRLIGQAASGLTAAHQAGIVHRDLKPGNIFLLQVPGEGAFVKLLDFGISKRAGAARGLTGEFDILGTPNYMAPEQASGRTAQVDHRGDQFALAVICYQMLTGTLPFPGDSVMEILQHVLNDEPTAPSQLNRQLPSTVDAVVARALSKNPADRYDNIGAFAQELLLACDFIGHVSSSLFPGVAQGRAGSSTPAGGYASGQQPTQPMGAKQRNGSSLPPRTATSQKPLARGASSATVEAVGDLLDQARRALDEGDPEAAVGHAEGAIDLANSSACALALRSIDSSETLLARIFEQRLGELTRTVQINLPSTRAQLSPQQAFLLSRLEGGVTFEEALDLTPLSRPQALLQLVQLLRAGLIEAG